MRNFKGGGVNVFYGGLRFIFVYFEKFEILLRRGFKYYYCFFLDLCMLIKGIIVCREVWGVDLLKIFIFFIKNFDK